MSLVQMSLWVLESHRQTCLSYPQVRNWGFQGWTARPHSSSVWPWRGVFFLCNLALADETTKKKKSYTTGQIKEYPPTLQNIVVLTCVMHMNCPSRPPCKTKFLVVPMSTVSPRPSAMVRMGPNISGTCGEEEQQLHKSAVHLESNICRTKKRKWSFIA